MTHIPFLSHHDYTTSLFIIQLSSIPSIPRGVNLNTCCAIRNCILSDPNCRCRVGAKFSKQRKSDPGPGPGPGGKRTRKEHGEERANCGGRGEEEKEVEVKVEVEVKMMLMMLMMLIMLTFIFYVLVFLFLLVLSVNNRYMYILCAIDVGSICWSMRLQIDLWKIWHLYTPSQKHH